MSAVSAAQADGSELQPSAFPRAWTAGSVAGVTVRVDPSWLLFAVLLVVSFQTRFGADRPLLAGLSMALAAAVLFVASVVGHELGHALEAAHRGLEVRGVTLFVLGGVTEMDTDTRTARDDLAVAAVGPWANAVLAAVFGLAATWLDGRGLAAAAEVAGAVGWLNVALALFNLIPGAPLDGGRVLRAVVWLATGREHLAGRVAARIGQGLAVLALAGAAALVVRTPAAWLPALVLAVVSVYVLRGATAEHRRARVEEVLARHTAADLVAEVRHIRLELATASDAAAEAAERPRVRALLGLGADGSVHGWIAADDAAAAPDDLPATQLLRAMSDAPLLDGDTAAREVATALDDVPLVRVALPDGERPVDRRAVEARTRQLREEA